jgi:hypothetical protein
VVKDSTQIKQSYSTLHADASCAWLTVLLAGAQQLLLAMLPAWLNSPAKPPVQTTE